MSARLLLCLLAGLLVAAVPFATANSSESEPSPICIEDEKLQARELLFLFGALAIAVLFIYGLLKFHFHYLPESVATIAIGALFGLLFTATHSTDEMNAMRLNPEIFFIFLLPAIIFEAGFSLEKGDFFGNMGGIVLYAVLGTVISTVTIAIGLYVFGVWGFSFPLSLLDCLLFGSLISAVDPVATLAIFQSLNVNEQLFYLVFGESVVNDAVAIVLYKTFEYFVGNPFTGGSILRAFGQFLLLFVGSTVVGIVIGAASALFFKYTQMRNHPVLEFTMLITHAYMGYLFCEAVSLSGIMCVLSCGIMMSYYVRPNLSQGVSEMSGRVFKLFSFISETFVFLYLGFAIFAFHHKLHWGLIFWGIVFCLLGRALNIYPLSAILNRGRTNKISYKNQFVMFWSGLRGAIAFALAIGLVGEDSPVADGEMLFSTTLAIVLFTILIFGGLTLPLLKALKIEGKVTMSKVEAFEHVTTTDQYWAKIMRAREMYGKNMLVKLDERYFRRFFCREQTLAPMADSEARELDQLNEYWHTGEPDADSLIGRSGTQATLGLDTSMVSNDERPSFAGTEVVHIVDEMARDAAFATKVREAVALYGRMHGGSSPS
jgi:sodium/hydrogen exchanger 8